MLTICSVLVLFVSYYLFKKASGSLRLSQLNMVSWIFYFQLVVQSFVASVLVINDIDNHYVINRAGPEAKFQAWLSVQYAMIAIPVGMVLYNKLKNISNVYRLFNQYTFSAITPSISAKDSFVKIPLYALSLICLLAVLYTLAMTKNISISLIFQGLDPESIASARVSGSRGFTGNVYVKNLLAINLSPILTYIAFCYYRMSRTTAHMVWFLSLFMATFLILTYNFEKAPFLFFLIGFVFIEVLTKNRISKKLLYSFFITILTLLVLAYYATGYQSDSGSFLDLFSYNTGIGGRLFLGQAAGTYMSFEYFPSRYDFIGLSSLTSLVSLFDVETSERAARLLMMEFNPLGVEEGRAGVMNSLFISEAWANFGLLGVIISPVAVGMVVQGFYLFFLTSRKTPLMLGFFAFLSYKLPITGGVNDFVYNPLIFTLGFFMGSIYLIGVSVRKKKYIRYKKLS